MSARPPVPIANVDAFLDVIGQWNLYDMEIRGFAFEEAAPSGPQLDLTLAFEGHAFLFRFSGIEVVDLVGFGSQNVVGEYEFVMGQAGDDESSLIHVSIEGTVGGSVRCLCRDISVLTGRPSQSSGAV